MKYGLVVISCLIVAAFFNNCSPEKFKSNSEKYSSAGAISNSDIIKNIENQLSSQYSPVLNTLSTEAAANTLPSCTAKNRTEWEDCKNKLSAKSIAEIIIDGEISCSEASCALNVSDLQNFVLRGTVNGKFNRSGGFESALFRFSNMGQLTVDGIRVYESANQPTQGAPGKEEFNAVCSTSLENSHCGSTIEIMSSENVHILNSYFENGKVFNLMIYGNYSVNVDRTTLKNAFLFGAWGRFNKYVTIQNSIFEKNRSNGFLIDFGGSEEVNVLNNYFSRNHYATAFHVCGASGNEPCSGGQIDILGHIKKMTISGNKFINSGLLGEFPEDRKDGIYITCIEFEGSDKILNSVVIDNNYFANGDSGFFHINTPQNPSANHVQFSNNKYCQMPHAYFNFNSDSNVMTNTQEECIAEWNEVPGTENTYTWSATAWGACSATPDFSYGAWGACSTAGTQSRSSTCANQNGQQGRTLLCKNSSGANVSLNLCDVASQPAETQTCAKSCVGNPITSRSCQPTPAPAPVSLTAPDCEIPVGFNICSSTVTWDAPDYPSACIFVGESLFACQGPTSSKVMPWVSVAGGTVSLRESSNPSSRVIASIFVKGVLVNPTPPPVVTYSWESSGWGSCDAKPIFEYSNWSQCSSQNTQTRTYQCINQQGKQDRTLTCKNSTGQSVSDLNCLGLTKPEASQQCTNSCDGQQPIASQSCTYTPVTSETSLTATPTINVSGVTLNSSHCVLEAGKDICSSTVTWDAPDYPSVCVFVGESLFACQGSTSSKEMPWVSASGGMVFLKENNSASSKVLASVFVKALSTNPVPTSTTSLVVTPTIYVSGVALGSSHCVLGSGKTECSSTVTWNSPNYPSACIFVGESLFACEGPNSSKVMPWVSAAGITVSLRENSSPSSRTLATLFVKAVPAN